MTPTPTPAAGAITIAERDKAIEYLSRSRRMLMEAVEGLTDVQFEFSAGTGCWSIRDCVEHLAVTEAFVTRVRRACLRQPSQPQATADEASFRDQKIIDAVANRGRKVTAPEPVQPSPGTSGAQEAVVRFAEARDRTLEFLEPCPAGLRDHFAPHPFLGPLDLYQWQLFLAAHTERHTSQILEIRAAAGFPA